MATTVLGLKTFAASDPVDYNEVNDNYVKIDNGVKTAMQGRAAHNLLDNSDFRNPVNQRGQTSYGTNGYTIDRWAIEKWSSDGSDTVNLSVETNGIRLSGGTDSTSKPNSCYIRQKLDASKMLGKTYTIAVNVTSLSGDGKGRIHVGYDSTYFANALLKTGINIITFTMPSSASTFFMTIGNYASGAGTGTINVLMEWAALYEGSYTADTLPAYVPKGYAAELAECMRYYQVFGKKRLIQSTEPNGGFTISERFPIAMRVAPTITGTYVAWATLASGPAAVVEKTVKLATNESRADGFIGYYAVGIAKEIMILDYAFTASADL